MQQDFVPKSKPIPIQNFLNEADEDQIPVKNRNLASGEETGKLKINSLKNLPIGSDFVTNSGKLVRRHDENTVMFKSSMRGNNILSKYQR